jgi:predicted GTPase
LVLQEETSTILTPIYRNNEQYNVVAFTAAQIPDIDGRKYPAELAGKLYPQGIPIHAEEGLGRLNQRS